MRSRSAEASAASVDTIPACAGSGTPIPAMDTMRRLATNLRSRAIMQISLSLLVGGARASVPATRRVGKSGHCPRGASAPYRPVLPSAMLHAEFQHHGGVDPRKRRGLVLGGAPLEALA